LLPTSEQAVLVLDVYHVPAPADGLNCEADEVNERSVILWNVDRIGVDIDHTLQQVIGVRPNTARPVSGRRDHCDARFHPSIRLRCGCIGFL